MALFFECHCFGCCSLVVGSWYLSQYRSQRQCKSALSLGETRAFEKITIFEEEKKNSQRESSYELGTPSSSLEDGTR